MFKWLDKVKHFFDALSDKIVGKLDLGAGRAKAEVGVGKDVASLVDRLVNGGLTPDAFEVLFRAEIKAAYLEQYFAGIGGINRMTQADWGSIGGSLAEQYKWLDGFIDELRAGGLSEAQIRARAGMYLNSSREAYERAHGKCARELGMTRQAWILDGGEHCESCLAFAAEGPQPVGHFPFPGDGSTECKTNCLCELEYSNPDTGEKYE